MRVYREYHCDFGHRWTLICEEGTPKKPEDSICPEGHETVTLSEQPAADRVQILIRPAARIVDTIKRQIWYRDRYYLVLLDRDDRELRVSVQHYTWSDALTHASIFKDADARGALDLWQQYSL